MRHRVHAPLRVLAIAIGVLYQVGVHGAHPQYSTYGSVTAAAVPDEPGDLAAFFDCHGATGSDDPNYHLGLTTWLHWGTEFLKVHTEWGLGSIATFVRGDITIGRHTGKLARCDWSASWGGTWTDGLWYPARVPQDLQLVTDAFYPGGVGHYLRYRVYEVWDNYQRRFRYPGTPVYEHYSEISNGCNLTVFTGEAQLNGDARFSDSLVANGIEACNQFPNCVSRFEQLLQVESTVWSKEVAYACYGVTVTP